MSTIKRVAKRQVRSDIIQMELFKTFYSRTRYPSLTGYFFELVASALFGGTVDRSRTTGDYIPDVTDHNNFREIEVKSVSRHHQFKVSIDQFRFYEERFVDVRYCFFKTNIRRPSRTLYGKTFEDVFEALANNILFCWYIPLSAVSMMVGNKRLYYENIQKNWEPMVLIQSGESMGLLKNDLLTMKNLGIRTGKYRVYRRASPEIQVDSITVKPFPIIWLEDRR